MTINEYYSNYKVNKKYPIKLISGTDKTIEDFYKICIKHHILPKKNVLTKLSDKITNTSMIDFRLEHQGLYAWCVY